MSIQVMEIWSSIKGDILEYLKDTDYLSLIAHGSFTEGIANRNSDFDLLVVSRECEDRYDIMVVKDIEVDIDFMSEKSVRAQLESLDELLRPNKIGSTPPLASRLKNAVILIDTDDVGKNLIDTAKKFKPSFQLLDHYSRSGFGYYYDAVGAMMSGDYASSILMARIGALEVAAGILLRGGELYVKKKWFPRFMGRIPSAPTELFLRLMGLDTADKKKAAQCIQDLNQFISELQKMRQEYMDNLDENV